MSRTRNADGDEPCEVEVGQADLDGAGVVEAGVAGEVGVEALGQVRPREGRVAARSRQDHDAGARRLDRGNV